MPQAAAAATQYSGDPPPPWVLLDTPARTGRCEVNATTAASTTSAGHPIVVSFSVAPPPALSRCSVHCPGLPAEAFSEEPRVTGADGALLLIRVSFADGRGGMLADFFVYRAGPGGEPPSLHLVPRPYPLCFDYDQVGAISCGTGGGEHHLLVVPEPRFESALGRMDYDLHVFSTETMSWSTKVASVAVDMDYNLLVSHEPSKVISVGGVWLGWVDLRRGVLLCNVADDHPEMRLIQLPPLLPTNKADFEEGFDGVMPPLRHLRDVTCRDGLMRFIEVEYPELDDDSSVTQLRWKATMFTREICGAEKWDWCCAVDSADLAPADSCCLSDLFPEIWDGKKLTLGRVISSSPTLDMYGDSVFYMMSKMSADDLNGWVLVVNASNQTLEHVVPMDSEMFDFEPTYQHVPSPSTSAKTPG
ncbi:unnamed protein product [Urochloa humidicola]